LSPRISAHGCCSSNWGSETARRTGSFYVLLVALWLLAWRCATLLAKIKPATPDLPAFLIPALFGVWLLIIWEARDAGPAFRSSCCRRPAAIGARIANHRLPILAGRRQPDHLKAVLGGYVIGCGAGFVVAILATARRSCERGLLPIGNMVSALPIIGVAPIMVMWFGFDWPSKAAVVVIMTFFPMLVNTVAGLNAAAHMERDLMRTYAASYWQTLYASCAAGGGAVHLQRA
jgi:NitT/TauT family transport system permease protein